MMILLDMELDIKIFKEKSGNRNKLFVKNFIFNNFLLQ